MTRDVPAGLSGGALALWRIVHGGGTPRPACTGNAKARWGGRQRGEQKTRRANTSSAPLRDEVYRESVEMVLRDAGAEDIVEQYFDGGMAAEFIRNAEHYAQVWLAAMTAGARERLKRVDTKRGGINEAEDDKADVLERPEDRESVAGGEAVGDRSA